MIHTNNITWMFYVIFKTYTVYAVSNYLCSQNQLIIGSYIKQNTFLPTYRHLEEINSKNYIRLILNIS